MIYLYGLVEMADLPDAEQVTRLPRALGPVSAHKVGDWVLITSDFPGDEVLPKRRLMLAHTRIVETMMAHGTVLPARFGLLAADVPTVERLIRTRTAEIATEFARVQGQVELGIRISFDRDTALQATLRSNAALLQKRDALAGQGPEAHFARAAFGREMAEALDRRRGAAQREILKALLPLATAHLLRAPEEDVEVLRAELLVPHDDQDTFIKAVAQAAVRLPFAPGAEPMVQIIGPAPPYNFVRLSLTPDEAEDAA